MANRSPISAKNAAILRALRHLTAEQRKAIIAKGDKDLIKCIAECALNTLKGNIPISKNRKQNLRRHASSLRKLVEKGAPLNEKKEIIVHRGGGVLTALLPVIATVLAEFVAQRK